MRGKHELILDIDNPFAVDELMRDETPWYIPKETRIWLLEHENYTCRICKRQFKPAFLHIDHIQPVSKGGKALLRNLQVLCQTCNLQKSDHVLDPASYLRGYAIPIYTASVEAINRKILEKVEDEYA